MLPVACGGKREFYYSHDAQDNPEYFTSVKAPTNSLVNIDRPVESVLYDTAQEPAEHSALLSTTSNGIGGIQGMAQRKVASLNSLGTATYDHVPNIGPVPLHACMYDVNSTFTPNAEGYDVVHHSPAVRHG